MTLRTRCVVVFLALAPAVALAQGYEGAHRQVEDAGVHVPVLTKAPELLQFVAAEYPKEAEAAGLTGAVKMTVTIAADGSVADAVVTEGAGNGFDEAALAAVRQFKFSPAEIDNAPAAVSLEYVYNFT